MRTAYFDETGRVLIVSEIAGMGSPENAEYVAAISDGLSAKDIYYDIENGETREKASFNLTVTRNRIDQIPAGSRVIFGAIYETVNDGSVDFLADVEEVVTVYLEHLEYRSIVVEVQTGP